MDVLKSGKMKKGLENRYANDFSGNHIARLRKQDEKPLMTINHFGKLRFCETCQKSKPKHGYAFKGWQCEDCMNEKKEITE
jgi:hypothetical protein